MSTFDSPVSALPASPVQRTEIVFVESNVADYRTLIRDIDPALEIHVLDAGADGLAQIAQILAGRSGIDAIHLISHGAEGVLQLGAVTLNDDTLQSRATALAVIGNALRTNGDILLYGCNVAKGATGIDFIGRLAQATGADVAASDDLTGALSRGGDWVLEDFTGTIEASTLHGEDWNGQLGLTVTPQAIMFPGHSTGESRNQYAFAALRADGSVVTWGDASYGGDSSAVAAELNGGIDVTQIFSSERAFAALRADGSVVTWGDGDWGGNSSTVAAQLNGVDNTKDVTRVFSTSKAFAALRADGSLVTWGDTDWGGNSNAVATKLDGTTDVTQVSSTWLAFAALRADGSVVTWGAAIGGGDSSAVAAKLNGTIDTQDVRQVFSTADAFAALRADGSVVTWGSANGGGDSSAVLTQLDGTNDAQDVTQVFSASRAFAALRADGSIVTWGDAIWGGNSSTVAAQLNGTNDAQDVREVFSTQGAFAALRADGSVVTWGDASYGGDSSAVTEKLDGTNDTRDVTQVFSTRSAFAALRADGSVVTWGDQGGNSGAVATQLNGSIKVTQVFSTEGAFAALRADGSVVTWGNPNSGGDSSAVAAKLDGAIDVTQVFSTQGAFAAQRADGSVVTWGSTNQGGTSTAVASQLTHVVSMANPFAQDVYIVNAAPTIAANAILTLNEGGSATLGVASLSIADADSAASNLTLTLASIPAHGTLYKSGLALMAGSTFTQADIANGLVTYTHTGGDTTADAFTFVVSDGKDGSIAKTTFNIAVTPVNDAPTFAVGDGKVTTAIGAGGDYGYSVTVQPDGKVLVAGNSINGGTADFALVRYDSNGLLDTTFGGTGKVTTAIGAGGDYGDSVTVQPDGKILVAGGSYNGSNYDFALVRYNNNGLLDTTFGGTGKVTTAIGAGFDLGYSVTMQPDGKILVAGYSQNGSKYDFALVRYDSNGLLDTTFDGTGKITTAIGANSDYGYSVTVQPDGKILVAGSSYNGSNYDFALVRYDSYGLLDTTFGGSGKVTTAIGTGIDYGYSVTVQPDGKILVAGYSNNGSNDDFALVRYDSNGLLDTTFGSTGKVTTAIGAGGDYGYSVTVQPDGKILVAGYSNNGSNNDFALVRYDSNGLLDTTFGGSGKVTTAIGATNDVGRSVTVQPDGKILVAGNSINGSNDDFALVRYNADGSLDTTFDAAITLDGQSTYTENGSAVVLDSNVQIHDSELAASGNYDGASLTLARHGTASADDLFSGAGIVAGQASGTVTVSNTDIGIYTWSSGTLTVAFNTAATQSLVDSALQTIAYSNASHNPPASVQIDWTFSDGNTGGQGAGGALSTTGSTTVSITAVNDAPVNTVPGAQTLTQDTPLVFDAAHSNLISIADADAGSNPLQVTLSATHGTLTLSGTAGLTFVGGDGTADATMTLIGTQADINTALDGLSYTPTAGYSGSASLLIVTDDQGNTGGGAQSDTDTLNLTVNATIPANHAPVITSNGSGATASLSLTENRTAVTNLTATDPDNDPLTYSLTGGADQGKFAINASTGALSFISAPNYEAPTDAGADNTYEVIVRVSDGTATDEQTLTVTVTDVNESTPPPVAPGGDGSGNTSTPPPLAQDVDVDGDSVSSATESLVQSINGTPTGDGNGDGLADNQQSGVASVSFVYTDTAHSHPGNAAPTYVTLVADSLAGRIDTTDSCSAKISHVQQLDAPTGKPAELQLPLGLIDFTVSPNAPGITETFSLFVDDSVAINGYWTLDAHGVWANLASRIEHVGNKIRVDFSIKDGGIFDADGLANGTIVDQGSVGSLSRAAATLEERITGLYVAFYDRAPDADGLAYWSSQVVSGGATLYDIANGFAQHPRFAQEYGGLDNSALAAKFYNNVLGRSGDAAGITYWQGQLDQGLPVYKVVADLVLASLNVDLLSAKQAGTLTDADFSVAYLRQNLLDNKVMASLDFVTLFGQATVPHSASNELASDAAYSAAIQLLDSVSADPASVYVLSAELVKLVGTNNPMQGVIDLV